MEQLKIHLLLNLSRCRRKQGHLVEAIAKASEVLTLRPDCLEALHARARANRDCNNFEDAIADLTEALKMSPQNRDLHRLILKVKKENAATNRFNNNSKDGEPEVHANVTVPASLPVGARLGAKFKFVDDANSDTTTS